jgi:hypothetical protein
MMMMMMMMMIIIIIIIRLLACIKTKASFREIFKSFTFFHLPNNTLNIIRCCGQHGKILKKLPTI